MLSRSTLALAAALAAVPATTFADSTGNAGFVIAVTVHETSSDDYANHHGRVLIREGSEPGAPQTEYRWGGTVCASRVLSAANVALLVEALRGRSDTQLIPRFKMGQAGTRCLTSFIIQEPVFAAPR